MMAAKFFEEYFSYVSDTESPKIYHRWCAISSVAALLGRGCSLPFGHSAIYPNMYILLVGNPGTRKGSALKPASNVLSAIGFDKLAPQRVSPERFIVEMQNINNMKEISDDELGEILVENLTNHKAHEIYVISEEFGDFIKKGNIDFLNLLTNLWDNLPEYKHPKIHGKSIYVYQPTVNIIGATTQQGIALHLPIEAIGQGGTSRFIFVHGESTGIKITFPRPPSSSAMETIKERLTRIQCEIRGSFTVRDDTAALLHEIYQAPIIHVEDGRFQYYNSRRFTHLLKLCMVFAAMDLTMEITMEHVLQANTLLYVTEQRMPKALGQFGKGKHADVANSVMEILRNSHIPLDVKDLWIHVGHDLDKYPDDMIRILKNLEMGEKIFRAEVMMGGGKKKVGFRARGRTKNEWGKEFLIQSEFLSLEERI